MKKTKKLLITFINDSERFFKRCERRNIRNNLAISILKFKFCISIFSLYFGINDSHQK